MPQNKHTQAGKIPSETESKVTPVKKTTSTQGGAKSTSPKGINSKNENSKSTNSKSTNSKSTNSKKKEQNSSQNSLKNGKAKKQSVKNGSSKGNSKTNIKKADRYKKADNKHLLKQVGQAAVIVIELAAVLLLLKMLFGGRQPAAVDVLNENTAQPTVIEQTRVPETEPEVEQTIEPTIEPTAEPTPEASLLPLTDLSEYTEGGLRLTEQVRDEHPYAIYTSKETFTIAVLGIDENGEYTRLLRTWRTAIGTGNKTRAGNYKIDKKYLWYEWLLGGYTPYTSRLEGSSIRLHSPLHNENKDWESLYRAGYRQIGSKETQGCLRTTTAGAAWIYYNCPIGTQVTIKNDDLYTSEAPPELGDSKSDPTRPMSSDDLEIPVTFFEVAEETLSLRVGDVYTISLSGVMPTLEEHEEIEEIAHSFVYVSGNENVVTVNENGVITAVGEGSAELLIMADDVNKAYRIIEVSVGQN